jgi:hypothetical protein
MHEEHSVGCGVSEYTDIRVADEADYRHRTGVFHGGAEVIRSDDFVHLHARAPAH